MRVPLSSSKKIDVNKVKVSKVHFERHNLFSHGYLQLVGCVHFIYRILVPWQKN